METLIKVLRGLAEHAGNPAIHELIDTLEVELAGTKTGQPVKHETPAKAGKDGAS